MTATIVFPAILVGLISYILVLVASWQRRSPAGADYLFAGNTLSLSVSSGIGSLFSVSLACTALLASGYVYGWEILFSAMPGAFVALTALRRLSQKPLVSSFQDIRSSNRSLGVSYVSLLGFRYGKRFQAHLSGLLVAIYFVVLLSELAVLRVTLTRLVNIKWFEPSYLLILIAAVSFSYVYIGGYRGVLLSDRFQVVVLVAFFGVLLAEADWAIILSSIPGPADGLLVLPSPLARVLLHAASFGGSAILIFSSADQWVRTFGTLSVAKARMSITVTMLVSIVASCVLVILGSHFGKVVQAESLIAGVASLDILEHLVETGSETTIFMFSAALACVTLTTIDTYYISLHQFYYEFVGAYEARSGREYLFEYLVRWPNVRMVILVLASAATFGSFAIPDTGIYVLGVTAMSSLGLLAPPLLVELLPNTTRFDPVRASIKMAPKSILLSALSWPIVLALLRFAVGPVTYHLYLIVIALGGATCLGYGGVFLHSLMRYANEGH